MDDPLLNRVHAAERQAARSRALAYGVLIAVWCPLLFVLVYVGINWVGPFTGVCPAPDPSGGMLSDAEPCRGNTPGLFLMASLGIVVWVAGMVIIARRIGRPVRSEVFARRS